MNPLKVLASEPTQPMHSTLALPIRVSTEVIRQALVNLLPVPIFEGKTELPVPLGAAQLSTIIAYRGNLLGLGLSVQGTVAELTADITFHIQVSLDTQTKSLDLVQVGQGAEEDQPRVRLVLTAQVSWADNGRLVLSDRAWRIIWLNMGSIKGLAIGIADLLDLPFIQQKFNDLLDTVLLSDEYAEFSLNTVLASHWEQLQHPIPVRDGVWLQLNPQTLALAELQGEGSWLTTQVGVSCRPAMTVGPRPEVEPIPLPPSVLAVPENGFAVTIQAEITFQQAEKLLLETLTENQLTYRGFRLVVENVRIIGNQNHVAVILHVTSPFKGSIFLRGIPRYHVTEHTIWFEHLTYRLSSRSLLPNLIDKIFHEKIQELLVNRLRFNINSPLTSLIEKIQDLELELTDDPVTYLRLGTRTLDVQKIALESHSIVVYLTSQGTAEVQVGLVTAVH